MNSASAVNGNFLKSRKPSDFLKDCLAGLRITSGYAHYRPVNMKDHQKQEGFKPCAGNPSTLVAIGGEGRAEVAPLEFRTPRSEIRTLGFFAAENVKKEDELHQEIDSGEESGKKFTRSTSANNASPATVDRRKFAIKSAKQNTYATT